MPFILGFPLTALVLWIASLIPAFGYSLVWPVTAIAALWVFHDAKDRQLARYERIFPLDPLGAAFAVLLMAIISFPWYLRLRWKAERGELEEVRDPSRAKFVLLGVLVTVWLVAVGGARIMLQSDRWQRLLKGPTQLATQTGGQVYADENGTVTMTLPASTLADLEGDAREDSAKAIAMLTLDAIDTNYTLRRVVIVSAAPADPGWVQFRRPDPQYSWSVDELRSARH